MEEATSMLEEGETVERFEQDLAFSNLAFLPDGFGQLHVCCSSSLHSRDLSGAFEIHLSVLRHVVQASQLNRASLCNGRR